jgi:3-methyladenine DNA glycosylase/8-oxoguanine DNA glycosylase
VNRAPDHLPISPSLAPALYAAGVARRCHRSRKGNIDPESRAECWRGVRIYTIGHSTRTLGELVELLRAFDISVVADIRTIPRSRHNPQFNGGSLRTALRPQGLRYVHLAGLGGLRRAGKDSPNTGWRNASFRGFADYMLTEDFETGLEELRALTAQGRVAFMCAEAVPWRCHRSLVADALTARGANVEHIISSSRSTPHRLTPFAKVKDARVSYPGEGAASGRLPTRAPFHLEATVRVLQRRPENPVEVWERDRYLRVLASADGLALVEVENRGTIDDPDVRFSIRSGDLPAAARSELEQTLRKVLGLDVDPEPLQRLAEAERALRPTALALRGMRPPRFAEWFEAFANVVPFQQLSLDAGLAIVGRLVERFGKHLEHGGRRFYAFPTAHAIAGARVAALRECGLSVRKAESLRYLARAIASGELTEEKISGMSTADALRTLTELPGIGPWSAGLVLLRGLGRMDVFPPGDVGAARRIGELMRLRSGASLGRILERFGDSRGYLYFCGLGGSLLAQGLIHAAPPSSVRRSHSSH